ASSASTSRSHSRNRILERHREYGLIDIGTFREASEPDTIVVLMEVTDVAWAKEYWHSQVLEAGRRRAGVVGPLQAGTDQVWLTNGPVIQWHPGTPGEVPVRRVPAGAGC